MKSGFVPEQNTEIFDVCLKIRYPEPERSFGGSGVCGGAWPEVMGAVAFSAFICQTGGLDPGASGSFSIPRSFREASTQSGHMLRYRSFN